MAKEQKKNDAKVTEDGMIKIDIGALLPEGYAKDDLVTVGGLRPIVPAEVTFERRSPIVGYLLTVIDMPLRPKIGNPSEKEPWQTLLVRLTQPAFAQVGDDVKEIPAGKDVVVPINGNLRNNHDLLGAAVDQQNVWLVAMYVEGQIPMKDNKNDMWSYVVQIHKKAIARTGPFALFNRISRALPPGTAKASDGTVYDAVTGEVRSAVGAAAAS